VGAVGRVLGVVFILGLSAVGCGGGGGGGDENDQGISFRAVGIFQGEQQEDQCEVPTTENQIADTGIAVPLDGAVFPPPAPDQLIGGYPDSNAALSFCRGFIQLDNDLNNQAIVVERFDFVYEIPGSRIAIPENSAPTGFRINPANADPEANPNPFGQVNTIFIQLNGQLIPSTLVLFLRQNQQSLPALPYVMIIHVTARGRTDSGDVLVTNEVRYTVELTS
jgi:hypothetical protein